MTPVEVTMKVNTKYSFNLRKDSVTLLSTAGILGETYVDVDSKTAKGPEATDGDVLEARDQPQIEDVVRASQSTLQNIDTLLKRVDRIVAFIESGQGSIGKVIYDPRCTTSSTRRWPSSRDWWMTSSKERARSARSSPATRCTRKRLALSTKLI
jgi:phospholipid/cholesterol/gamma-HCH transport system substrate-binding protein